MAKRNSRLLTAACLGASLLLGSAARADVELVFGIYAAAQPVKMMWQCGTLVDTMERHMSRTLAERVVIDVQVEQNFDIGVEDVTAGYVDFAHFPNVERHWVIHPDVPERVVLAWRSAYTELGFERLPYRVNPHVYIEGDIGHCQELERQVASDRIFGAARF